MQSELEKIGDKWYRSRVKGRTDSNLVIHAEIGLGGAQDSTLLREVSKDQTLGIQRDQVVDREWERKVRLGIRRNDNIVGSAIPDRGVIDWVVDLSNGETVDSMKARKNHLCSDLLEVDRKVIRVVDPADDETRFQHGRSALLTRC